MAENNPNAAGPSAAGVSIYPLLAVNFIGSLGFSIVLPFLVFLVTRWGGNAFVYGIVGATYSVFQLGGAAVLGRWSDRYGRRRILLLSQAGTLASWVVFISAFALPVQTLVSVESELLGGFAITLPLVAVFVARAFDGLTGGNVSVANAYLADVTEERHRSANFGRMAVSANLGFILGPAIAGLLGATRLGEVLPVAVALAISAFATVIIAFRLPESRPCEMRGDPDQGSVRKVFGQEQKPCFEVDGGPQVGIRGIFALSGVPPLLMVYFLVMMGFNFYYIAFPVYASEGLGWSVRDVGIHLSVLSLLMVVVQGPLLGRLSRSVSDVALVVVGSLVLAGSFLFYTASETLLLYAGAVLLALGNGLMWPSVVSMLSKAAGSRHQGAVQGFASSLGAVASIVGLVGGGLIYANLQSAIFLVSSASIGVVFLITIWLSRRFPWTARERTP